MFCVAGLSVDDSSNKLYWINSGNGTVNRCNLDGSGLEVIDSLKKELMKATALAVMGKLQECSSVPCPDWLKDSSLTPIYDEGGFFCFLFFFASHF